MCADFNWYLNKTGLRGLTGKKGDQGFSPIVDVVEDTIESYKLKITTENNEIETPNLKGSLSIQDQGGTYVRYDRESGELTANEADRATKESYGIVRLAKTEDLDNLELQDTVAITPEVLREGLGVNLTSPDGSIDITQNPDTLKTELRAVTGGIESEIAQERAERIAADSSITQSVSTLSTNLQRTDNKVLDIKLELSDEIKTRMSADIDLDVKIDDEVNYRMQNDLFLQEQIDAERQERETQDTALQSQLGTKLTADNIKQGENITITRDGNNVTINSTGGGVVPENMMTVDTNQTVSGQKVFQRDTLRISTGNDYSIPLVEYHNERYYTSPDRSSYFTGALEFGENVTGNIFKEKLVIDEHYNLFKYAYPLLSTDDVDNQTIKVVDGKLHADFSEIGDEVNTLAGRMNTAESNITTLQTEMTDVTGNVEELQSKVKDYQAGVGLDLTGDNNNTFDLMTEDKYEEKSLLRLSDTAVLEDGILKAGSAYLDYSNLEKDDYLFLKITRLSTGTNKNLIAGAIRETDNYKCYFVNTSTIDMETFTLGLSNREQSNIAWSSTTHTYYLGFKFRDLNKTPFFAFHRDIDGVLSPTSLFASSDIFWGVAPDTFNLVSYLNILEYDLKESYLQKADGTKIYLVSPKILIKPAAKATTEKLGLVKVDGSTITVDEDGTIHGSNSVEVDNNTIEINEEGKLQTTVDINALQAKVEDLALFKFPNVTIIGEPTINNGQISNFSINNYLQFPFEFETKGRTWLLNGSFDTRSDVTIQQNIIDSLASVALAVRNGRLVLALSTNGTSFDLGEHTSDEDFDVYVYPNTKYYFKLGFNGYSYDLAISTDKQEWTPAISVLSDKPIASTVMTISSAGHPFGGIINLNDWDLTVASLLVWQGMDDVGISSRLDVNASNITETGINHLKEVLGLANIETLLNEILGNEEAISSLVDEINVAYNTDSTPTASVMMLSLEPTELDVENSFTSNKAKAVFSEDLILPKNSVESYEDDDTDLDLGGNA